VVSQMRLPKREQIALEALQTAVSGKSSDLGQFVFAEDRSDMLEQALGVLQSNLTAPMIGSSPSCTRSTAICSHRVAELRHELKELGDSQDELLEANQKVSERGEADSDDKPKPPASAIRTRRDRRRH